MVLLSVSLSVCHTFGPCHIGRTRPQAIINRPIVSLLQKHRRESQRVTLDDGAKFRTGLRSSAAPYMGYDYFVGPYVLSPSSLVTISHFPCRFLYVTML